MPYKMDEVFKYFPTTVGVLVIGYAKAKPKIILRSAVAGRDEVSKGNSPVSLEDMNPEIAELRNPDWKELSERGRHISWVITSFDVEPPVWNEDKMKYMIYQLEKAPTTGRLHWQGFVQFEREQTHTQALKLVMNEKAIWMRPARDSGKARAYCQKRDSAMQLQPTEFGVFVGQGNRTHMLVDDIKSGLSKWELIEKHGAQQGAVAAKQKGIHDETMCKAKRLLFRANGGRVIVIRCPGNWYEMGTFGNDDIYALNKKGDFTGYCGQKFLVCDRSMITDAEVSQWVRYPLVTLSIKYESTYFCSEVIIIENCKEKADRNELEKAEAEAEKWLMNAPNEV